MNHETPQITWALKMQEVGKFQHKKKSNKRSRSVRQAMISAQNSSLRHHPEHLSSQITSGHNNQP